MADVDVFDLLVEDQGDAVALLPVLLGQDEAVGLGDQGTDLFVRAELKASG